jgi:hypothetical protein
MIFSTLCVGNKWVQRYSKTIDRIGKSHQIHVCSDYPESFVHCHTIRYSRKDFSYYEKIVNLLKLSVKYKQRVTHFDADNINLDKFKLLLDDNFIPFDSNTIYTNKLHKNEEIKLSIVQANPSLVLFMKVIQDLDCNFVICNYIDEKIISVPYIKGTSELLLNYIINVQTLWENLWHKGRVWNGNPHNEDGVQECNKWSNIGCGYCEGGALSLYAKKLNIKIDEIKITKKYLM